jgi:hypothetical protein
MNAYIVKIKGRFGADGGYRTKSFVIPAEDAYDAHAWGVARAKGGSVTTMPLGEGVEIHGDAFLLK